MSSATADSSAGRPGEGVNNWRQGTILTLTGLRSDVSMNGLQVRVEDRCGKDSDRWYVIVISRGDKVRVHYSNLAVPEPTPPKRARTAQRENGNGSPAGTARGRDGSANAPGQETRQRGGGRTAELSQAAQSAGSEEAAVESAQQAQKKVRRPRGAGGTAAEPAQAAKRARGVLKVDAEPTAAQPVISVPDAEDQTAAETTNATAVVKSARAGRGRPKKVENGQAAAATQLPAGTSSSSNAPAIHAATSKAAPTAEVASAASPQQTKGRNLLNWMRAKSDNGASPASAVASPAGSPEPAATRRGRPRLQEASERLEKEAPAAKASASRQRLQEAPSASPRAAVGSQEDRNGSNSSPSRSLGELKEMASPTRIHGKTPARTVEQIYQKKTQLEHILLRPDSYVGSTERQRQEMFVLSRKDSAADADGPRMERRVLEIVPALYKIFDEILVNAADNLARDPTQDLIRITIDTEGKQVSIHNNGKGVPVEMHGEHHCYVPELIFGHLLTSDNYDDDEKKVVGGRNGYGAKLTNIFSKLFVIETADSQRKKRYRQMWSDNMTKRADPEITACDKDFTRVTFQPDLEKFGMTHLEPDIVALMERRAYDVAASTRGRCRVFLNDKELAVHSFEDYVSLFLPSDTFRICETYNERWQVAIAVTDGSGAQQVSMVNSISTTRGGTHVNYIADQAIASIMERFAKNKEGKAAALTVKPTHVRQYLWIFVNCLIENPAFDSQTKETLTSKKDRFGSTCSLSESMLDAVLESGIIDTLTNWSKAMSQSDLARHLNKSDYGKQARLFGIAKLEDANQAGTKSSEKCTLIVTEGDSAKALAVAGLSVVGRDYYGVFPLRGKMRNVRDMTVKQMMENQEIEHLSRILALDATKQYEDVRSLRYGSLMIMADQDFDGSHIKGLMINFIQHWFPGLLKAPGFLKEFVTPIVKATKDGETKVFFTIPEYEAWKEEHGGAHDWKCKYYKGLGTSTSSEARDYFTDLEQHELLFEHSVEENADHDLIDMAFNRSRADDRKKWISDCEEGTFVDHSQPSLTYSDFVNKELVLWAQYDVVRMIPSIVDGLKPGQRKVLHACFRKKLNSDMKVAQLSGYVAEHTAYHHGEASLQGTIIGMAQNFVGSNNINLLVPSGQFGTRIQGGKDHAAARYIFTHLSPVTRCVFPEADDAVLEYLNEEGLSIEPKWYCPIIPMALVNGAEGIGVGWATTIPNYNPREIIQNIRRHLRGEELQAMLPWYRGFKGSLTTVDVGKFDCTGVATTRGRSRVEITELPVGRWTQDYKEWALEQLPKKDSDTRSLISEFREYHTETSVHFSLTVTPDKLAQAEAKGLHKQFHCTGRLSSTNMWLFDAAGKLKKYETPEDILTDFAKTRLETYQKRKEHHIARLEREAAVLNDKARFVLMVVEEELIVENRPAAEVCKDLRRHGFRTKRDIEAGDVEIIEVEAKSPMTKRPRIAKATETADMGPEGYGYLVKMKLWTLTAEKVAELETQLRKKLLVLEELRMTTLEEMWEKDLAKLEAALDAKEKDEAKDQVEANRLAKKADLEAEEAMINNQCVLVLCKNSTEIKRVKTGQWRAQKKGGGAGASVIKRARTKTLPDAAGGDSKDGAEAEDGDAADDADIGCVNGIFTCHDFDALLAFTSDGHVYTMQALDVPLKRKTDVGTAITTLVPGVEKNNHSITSVITVPQGDLKSLDSEFIILVTAYGSFKKIPLRSFKNVHIQRSGKPQTAIGLEEGDCLTSVLRATDKDVMVAVSKDGFVLPVPVQSLKSTNSLKAKAQLGMKFRGDDRIASCDIAQGAAPAAAADASAPVPDPVPVSVVDAESTVQPPKAAVGQAAAPSHQMPAKLCRVGGKFRRRAVADDDDSDEEMPPQPSASSTAPAPLPLAAETSVESSTLSSARPAGDGDASDGESAGDGDADEDEKEEGSENENEEAEEAKNPSKQLTSRAAANVQSTLSILILTNWGNGKRVPLNVFKLGKRRGKGIKGCKGSDGEEVAAVCIVPGEQLAKPPRKPLEPWELHKEHYFKNLRGNCNNDEELIQKVDEANKINFVELFNGLAEGERARFKEQHENDQKAYEAAVEERKEQWTALSKVGQVIVCTSKGLVKRVMSATVTVGTKGGKCRNRIVKVDRNDSVMTAVVISAADDEREEVAEEQEEIANERDDVAEVEASN